MPLQSVSARSFRSSPSVRSSPRSVAPASRFTSIEFSDSLASTPQNGPQLFSQRLAALRSGRLYTRLPGNSFRSIWSRATRQPTYQQWRWLLAQEARVVARGQGSNRLVVLLGDSLSLWFPSDRLPSDRLWLNQSLSGDTTSGILKRLSDFAQTRPSTIYLMAGVNDLKRGASDEEILSNQRQILRRLKLNHPHAEIIVQSILPTQIAGRERIGWLNYSLAAIAAQEGATFLDLYSHMADSNGHLRSELTYDGLHLNANGYNIWQDVLGMTVAWR